MLGQFGGGSRRHFPRSPQPSPRNPRTSYPVHAGGSSSPDEVAPPILLATFAEIGEAKKNHACAPLPERERSTAGGVPRDRLVSANAATSSPQEPLGEIYGQKPTG